MPVQPTIQGEIIMTTAIEYALIAGASYVDTRVLVNRFSTPEGWTMGNHQLKDSGFENVGTPFDYETRARTDQAGLQLTIPLYEGGTTNSRVTEAIANKNKAAAELEVARRQSGTDAKQAYSAIVNGLAQIEALKSAVESSQSAVKGNQIGYKLGIHMNIDVLNAVRQLYTAQRDLLKARYDTLFQGFKLKAAAGALTASDVLEVNGLLGYGK